MNSFVLETERLLVRPFVMDDLQNIRRILDIELAEANYGHEETKTLGERMQWVVMSYEELAKLYQPPHGERASVLKQMGQLIGAIGFVPCLAPFEQLPSLRSIEGLSLYTTEFGLYYALSPAYRRQGYATEAARAMTDYAFDALKLRHIIATTTYDNAASMGVMRKLGMRVEKNPFSAPPWFQVVGILENSSRAS